MEGSFAKFQTYFNKISILPFQREIPDIIAVADMLSLHLIVIVNADLEDFYE